MDVDLEPLSQIIERRCDLLITASRTGVHGYLYKGKGPGTVLIIDLTNTAFVIAGDNCDRHDDYSR